MINCKKIIFGFLAALLLITSCHSSCGSNKKTSPQTPSNFDDITIRCKSNFATGVYSHTVNSIFTMEFKDYSKIYFRGKYHGKHVYHFGTYTYYVTDSNQAQIVITLNKHYMSSMNIIFTDKKKFNFDKVALGAHFGRQKGSCKIIKSK